MSTHTIRVMTCNALKSLDERAAAKLIVKVTAQADIILWQELTSTHKKLLRNRAGWSSYFPDNPWGIGISWRVQRFAVARPGRSRNVVPGIKRVDPARGFADIVLKDKHTQVLWPVVSAHMTHQAFTSHPERRPRWWLQAAALRIRSRRLARRWGRVVGGADVNRHRWAPGRTDGVWARSGTFGKAKYDVLWHRGDVRLAGTAQTLPTPSDHHALVAWFRAG